MRFRKLISLLISFSIIASTFSGCGVNEEINDDQGFMERPSLISGEINPLYDDTIVPSIPSYKVASDLSNVINSDVMEYMTDDYINKLAENYFVVSEGDTREFFEEYEYNVYFQYPNFVTVDSLMHTYHLYFAHLLKNVEKKYLGSELITFSKKMYDSSKVQYNKATGTLYEKAAIRNVAYFAVALKLLGEECDVPEYAKSLADNEVYNIMDASSVKPSDITGNNEDYSQYKPRGYYDESTELSQYFRTMMWFGRMSFNADNEDMTRSAILMSLAINDDARREWKAIYSVTSFFAGVSDDYSYCEYYSLMEKVYGEKPSLDKIISKDKTAEIVEKLANLEPPRIQSIPVYDDEENVIPSFRVMGQRFSIDANIMQNLIYRAVEENDNGECRMLPAVLDVPAALGSDTAKEITMNEGAAKFPDYETNLEKIRKDIENEGDALWTNSLYSGWLNTLRPLLTEKGEGYPVFMQNKEWTKKTLETFAGSYTELKHDTVLYGKQPMSEMGGGPPEDVDERGFVEPEPLVYARFSGLAKDTLNGLEKYKMISDDDKKALGLLDELATKLLVISQKELKNELLTDEEYELIRNYGGNLEHFWFETVKPENPEEYAMVSTSEYPAALVVDVATDPNGTVLEAGIGNPCEIAVIVPVDGILRICYGSVYNYYEFEQPMDERLTDSEWRRKIGAEVDDDYTSHKDESIDNPDWTKSYRAHKYKYDYN